MIAVTNQLEDIVNKLEPVADLLNTNICKSNTGRRYIIGAGADYNYYITYLPFTNKYRVCFPYPFPVSRQSKFSCDISQLITFIKDKGLL